MRHLNKYCHKQQQNPPKAITDTYTISLTYCIRSWSALSTPNMNLLYCRPITGQGTSFIVPSFCLRKILMWSFGSEFVDKLNTVFLSPHAVAMSSFFWRILWSRRGFSVCRTLFPRACISYFHWQSHNSRLLLRTGPWKIEGRRSCPCGHGDLFW